MNSSGSSHPRHLHQPLLLLLPDEISINCIARVPRVFHPNLSLVSRSWRDLLKSALLFAVRSDLGRTQHFLCLEIDNLEIDPQGRNPRRFLPLPPPPIPTVGSACASVGARIFVLGGTVNNGISSTSIVQIFDARFNRGDIGPPMCVSRNVAVAGVVDGKVYVLGGCMPLAVGWVEVFDPELGTWAPVPSPGKVREKLSKWILRSTVLDGKILAIAGNGGVVFDPQLSSWDSVSKVLGMGWKGRATAVEGHIYTYDKSGEIKGYDSTEDRWKEVEEIDRNLPKILRGAYLANVGDRLCVVWQAIRKVDRKEMEIMCAEIKLSKGSGGRLRGSIVWLETIIPPVPMGSLVFHCLAVQL